MGQNAALFTCQYPRCWFHETNYAFESREERDRHMQTCPYRDAFPSATETPSEEANRNNVPDRNVQMMPQELLELGIPDDAKQAIDALLNQYETRFKPDFSEFEEPMEEPSDDSD